MRANIVFPCLLLTGAWIILQESISLSIVVFGFVISACGLCICFRLFPLPKIGEISFLRLLRFVLYMFGQIYVAGIAAIKLIITGARVGVLTTKTDLSNVVAKTFLANSITTIPGTITIDLVDDELTVLCLCSQSEDDQSVREAEEFIIHSLESRLKKLEK